MKHLLVILILLPLFAHAQVRSVLAQHPIDDATTENLNDGIIGNWKFREDTNKNNYYEVIRHKPYMMDRYHIKFWDRGGTNPTYESNLHFSKVGSVQFINVPYFEGDFEHRGYFFLRVLNVNAGDTEMTAALVGDKTLWDLDQAGVKKRMVQNLNNPKFYSDTVHLYKMK